MAGDARAASSARAMCERRPGRAPRILRWNSKSAGVRPPWPPGRLRDMRHPHAPSLLAGVAALLLHTAPAAAQRLALPAAPARPRPCVGRPGTAVHTAAASDDGHRVALLDTGGTITVWDSRRCRPIMRVASGFRPGLHTHGGPAPIALDRGGHYLAVGGEDGRVRAYEVPAGYRPLQAEHAVFKGADGRDSIPPGSLPVWRVTAVAFDATSGYLATTGTDGSLAVWVPWRQPALELRVKLSDRGETARPTSVAFSGDGNAVAVASQRELQIVALHSERATTVDSSGGAWRVRFNPAGTLLTAARSGELRVYSVATREQRYAIAFSPHFVPDLATFSPDGRYLAALDRDARVRVFDAATGVLLEAHPAGPAASALWFTADSRAVVTADRIGDGPLVHPIESAVPLRSPHPAPRRHSKP